MHHPDEYLSSCHGKKIYLTATAAWRAVQRMNRLPQRARRSVNVYRCPSGHHWHCARAEEHLKGQKGA